MQHRVIERVDALEVFRIEHVLGADPVGRLGAEIGLEQPQHRTQDRQAGQAELARFLLQPPDQVGLEQRVEDDARLGLDLGQHAIELPVGAHGRIDVLHGVNGGILRGRGARHGHQRLAGGVGDEVEMKEARGLRWHRTALWKTRYRWGEGHALAARASTPPQSCGDQPT